MSGQLDLFDQPENEVSDEIKEPRLIHADCLDAMRAMEADSIDAIVTDPPYGLVQNKKGGSGVASVDLSTPYGRARIGAGNGPGGFMGKEWDSRVPGVPFWIEALRVAKPGAHLVAFGGTRTYHRLACAIEDAGWEVRDCLSWLYGSGFPKSRNIGKDIDGDARPIVGEYEAPGFARANVAHGAQTRTTTFAKRADEPVTDAARQWNGWGTALKPAWEPIILARKPLVGTVAANVLAHGTGAINVDGCRIEASAADVAAARVPQPLFNSPTGIVYGSQAGQGRSGDTFDMSRGRWPANVALDESAAATLDAQNGTVSRFFYTAKASRKERGEGNGHPTVKPIALMRWLVRLVTPPGGLVLDPFAGSGTTLLAARAEGCCAVGVEREAEYVEIMRKRLEKK